MATNAREALSQIIDHIERIREELLKLQHSMEEMESANPSPSDRSRKKTAK
jgi:uncharacterized protein (UPF0335 family)